MPEGGAFVGIFVAIKKTRGHHQIHITLAHGSDQFWDFGRRVLPIAVTAEDIAVTMRIGITESCLYGAANPEITGKIKDKDALFAGHFGCTVKGAVVDDKDIGSWGCRTDFCNKTGKRRLLIESRNNHQRFMKNVIHVRGTY